MKVTYDCGYNKLSTETSLCVARNKLGAKFHNKFHKMKNNKRYGAVNIEKYLLPIAWFGLQRIVYVI